MKEDFKNITGLADLQKMLDSLPAKVEQNIMRGALRAGANVIRDEAKRMAPVGPPSAQGRKRYKLYAGALRDSIRTDVVARRGKITATIKVGGRNKKTGADVWYAHIIEFTGAKMHLIKAKKGGSLRLHGQRYVDQVSHPGMKARPFFRPALDSAHGRAVIKVGEYVRKRLATKHGLNTAEIQIGEES